MFGMGYVRSVFAVIASGLQEVDLREELVPTDVTTDESEEGPLLFPALMKASPVIPLALFFASVKWSQWIYSEGIVDADNDISSHASFYQQYLDFLRREAAFHLSLCLWVAVTEFYREEEKAVPQFLIFFLMTLAFELSLNFSASLYDQYVESNSPLRTNFLTKLKNILVRSTIPSVISAPLIKSISFDILYSRESTSHPWIWVTLAGASTQIPRQMVAVFCPRIVNALLAYYHLKTDNEVSHSETEDEEQHPLLLCSTQIKGIDDSFIIALRWSLLATLTTALSWDMTSWLSTFLYKKLEYDKFDIISLLLLEMSTGASVGIITANLASYVVMASRKLCRPQEEIEVKVSHEEQQQNKSIPSLQLNSIHLIPASPINLSDRRKRATAIDRRCQLQVQLGIMLMIPAHTFNYHDARKILYEAAQLGDGLASCYLAFLYRYGLGVTPSLHAAAFFYKEANGNHAFIKLVKSVCYLQRLMIGAVSCYEDALTLLREAKVLSAQCEFKEWQYTREFLDRMSRVTEDVSGNLILALAYEWGLFEDVDLNKANCYYESVATQGESWTQYNLGMIHKQKHKDCPEGDKAKAYYATKAYYWFNLSVQPRHKVKEPLYWYNLGVLYREGQGVAQDYDQAKTCFEEARKLGSTAACSALATMYAEGLGCDKDLEKANKYEEESEIQQNNRRSAAINPLSIEEDLPALILQRRSKAIDFSSMSGYKELVWVKGLCDYCDDERLDRLSIKKGSIFQVYRENKNWLYAINTKGLKGMVPRNAIAIYQSKSQNKIGPESYQKLSIKSINEEEIDSKEELNNRTYTRVSLGFWKQENKQVIIKELKEQVPLEEIQDFRTEGVLMAQLNHPNIVKLLAFIEGPMPDSIEEELPPKLVMEYMSLGELSQHFPKKQQPLSEITLLLNEQRYEVALHIAQALRYLHAKGILHLDIKSMNVLLMLRAIECQSIILQRLCAKLADFGTARQCEAELTIRDSKRIGTEGWLSPELRDNVDIYYEYTAASDIYAYGVLLWEMFTYLGPDQVKDYLSNKPQTLVPEIPPDIEKLIRSCCADDPKARPIMPDIVARLSRSWGAPNQSDFFSQPNSPAYLGYVPLAQSSESGSLQPQPEDSQRTVYKEKRPSV